MRKMILWAIGIVAVVVVLSRSSDIAELLVTLQTGAWLPLVAAALFELAKYFSQAFAVSSAFEATGARRNPIKLVPVVFSAMFVNSLAPSGGTAGTLLYIEDARRDGVSIARSTPAILLYDVAYFLGFMIIMVIGFIVLTMTHSLAPYLIFAAFLLLLVVAGFSALLILGYVKPKWLHIGARWCEKKLAWFMTTKMHRAALAPWGEKIATSFADAAQSISQAPGPALRAVAFMTLTAGLDMLAMTAVGFAFGYTEVPMLVATYVVAQLLTIFSPTPQGVGIVETAIALLLTSFGVALSAATAIALVYRGYVYWIPFLLGAISLRFTKLFVATSEPSESQRARDKARVTALIILVLGVATIALSILPAPPGAWAVISEWLANGETLSPTWTVIAASMLVLLSHELWMRRRTGWALTMFTLLLTAVSLLAAGRGMRIAVVLLGVAVWLFVQRRVFSATGEVKYKQFRFVAPAAFALLMVLCYGTMGYLMLAGEFEGINGIAEALIATITSFIPFLPGPEALNEHAVWFAGSVKIVATLALAYAIGAVAFLVLRARIDADKKGRTPSVNTPAAPTSQAAPAQAGPKPAEPSRPALHLVVANDAPPSAPSEPMDKADEA